LFNDTRRKLQTQHVENKTQDFKSLSSNDTPPNSWIDLIVNPKLKTTKGQGVGAHSLVRNTLGVKGCVGALGWGLCQVTSKSIIHMDLHKSNNKLVSV